MSEYDVFCPNCIFAETDGDKLVCLKRHIADVDEAFFRDPCEWFDACDSGSDN